MKSKKILLPPEYFIFSILAVTILHFIIPIKILIEYPWNLLGLIPLIISGLLNLISDKQLKEANTTVKPFESSSNLITTGAYAITRNPMYLGMTLFLIGESIILGSVFPFLIPLLFGILMNEKFIKREERMLGEKFGNKYKIYKKNVRRWI